MWQSGRTGPATGTGRFPAEAVTRPGRPRDRADPGDGIPADPIRPDLERVFRAEYGRVVGIARRVLGPGPTAEDVAQDVFLAFGRSTAPARDAPGWLAVAAAHTALNALRAQARRTRRESAVAEPDRVPDVAEQVVVADGRARVREALGRLPRTQAMALLLRHSGLSYQEIAARLGLSAGSVGTTLRRAEAAVRKELESDGSPA